MPRGAYTGVGRTAPPPAAAAGLRFGCGCGGWDCPPMAWLESSPGDGADWNLGGTDADTASKLNRRPPAPPPLPLPPPPLPRTGSRAMVADAALLPLLPGVVVLAAPAAPAMMGVVLCPPEESRWPVRGMCLWCVGGWKGMASSNREGRSIQPTPTHQPNKSHTTPTWAWATAGSDGSCSGRWRRTATGPTAAAAAPAAPAPACSLSALRPSPRWTPPSPSPPQRAAAAAWADPFALLLDGCVCGWVVGAGKPRHA
jgi:hypothetical protein